MKIFQIAIQAQGGGAEKVALTLHNEFRRENDSWIAYLYSKLKVEFPNSIYLNLSRISPISLFVGVIKLFREVNRIKPDITLIHCEPALVLASLTPGLGKLFVVEHQPFYWRGLKGSIIKFALLMLTLRGCKTIHLRKSRTTSHSPIFIPNPIELLSIPTKPVTFRRNFLITWVGRLSHDKGFDRIPKILKLAQEKQIEIYGDGPLRQSVEFEGIRTNFYGFDPDVWKHLPNNSLLIITSRWEGDGLVILEALVRQIPLLVINFEDIEELPLPPQSICRDESEMSLKIRELRLGNLSPRNLINPSAFHQVTDSRNPREVSKKYLSAFKEVLHD